MRHEVCTAWSDAVAPTAVGRGGLADRDAARRPCRPRSGQSFRAVIAVSATPRTSTSRPRAPTYGPGATVTIHASVFDEDANLLTARHIGPRPVLLLGRESE